MGKDHYDDQRFEDFDEMDLIETRIREVRFMEIDLAAHLRTLGLPEARVVIESLDDDPCILIHELLLSADEASELIRRLDPKWKGQSYERDWKGLPDCVEEGGPPETAQEEQEELLDLSDPPRSDEPAKEPPPPSPELVLPSDFNRRQRQEVEQTLTFAEGNGHDLSDPKIKRRIVVNIVDTLRKRKISVVTR